MQEQLTKTYVRFGQLRLQNSIEFWNIPLELSFIQAIYLRDTYDQESCLCSCLKNPPQHF